MTTKSYKEFSIVTIEDEIKENNKTIITIGNIAIMECENEEQAKKMINQKDWKLIMNVAGVMANKIYELKKMEEKENENNSN